MNMKHLTILLLLPAVILLTQGTTHQEQRNGIPSHKGKRFLLGFLEMDQNNGKSAIYVTCNGTAQLNITIPYLNKTITKYVTPGVSTRIDISTAIRMRGMTKENKGILLTANVDVSVYATNARKTSRDVYVISPTSTLGSQYVVATYTPVNKSLVGVIALQDNTLVQIKLRMVGNITYMNKMYKNGDILRIFLNKLQTFQLQHTKDLTGTFVISTGPVVVLGGNICAMVPTINYGCSHLATQLLPVSKWGTRFITSPIASRPNNYFRIVAGYNDTLVLIRGKINRTLNAGEFEEFSLTKTESRYIGCSKPVMVIQYNKGSYPKIQSEPFALMVPPIEQYTNEYYLPISVQLVSPPFLNHITIVVKSSELGFMLFNRSKYCMGTTNKTHDTNYTIFSCNLDFTLNISTVIPIRYTSKGVRFAAFMVGHTDKDGYGYLGGMELKDVNCRRLFPQRLIVGDMLDNDCDGGIDEEIMNGIDDDKDGLIDEDTGIITSCDINSTIERSFLPNSEYLHGSQYNYTVTNVNDTQHTSSLNCEMIIKRIWSFHAPHGARVTAARQEIRWRKQQPVIVLPTASRLNHSVAEVRAISTLCPRDRISFNDSSSVKKNGTKMMQRTWFVHEDCGRVTTFQQTIIVDSSNDGDGRKLDGTSIALILSTALGIPVILLAMGVCIAIAWRRHVSRRVTITVHIDVQEVAKKDVYHDTRNAATVEDCLYSQIHKDVNHNSSTEQSNARSISKH